MYFAKDEETLTGILSALEARRAVPLSGQTTIGRVVSIRNFIPAQDAQTRRMALIREAAAVVTESTVSLAETPRKKTSFG